MTYVPICGVLVATAIIVTLALVLPALHPLDGKLQTKSCDKEDPSISNRSDGSGTGSNDPGERFGFRSYPQLEIEEFQTLLGPFLRERVSDTEGNLRVQEHIERVLGDLGWDLVVDRFTDSTPLGQKQFTNIVANIDPTSTSRLTLACHFDSKKFDNFVFIGATDSAVPCAMLLDAAMRLNDALWDSVRHGAKMTLQLIFFDGEEAFVDWTAQDSLYGSRHLAAAMDNWRIFTSDDNTSSISAIEAISYLILLDLIGTTDCQFVNMFPETTELYTRLQHIEKQCFENNLLQPVGGNSQSSEPNRYFADKVIPTTSRYGVEDDHIPFLRRNVSVLHLISLPFPSVWHRSTDNEEALSYPAINNLARILRLFLVESLDLK